MEQFELIRELGRGSSGKVNLYKNLTSNELFAIKQLKLKKDSIQHRRELFSLEKLRNCPHIIKIIKSFCTKDEFCIVLEYCEGGSLKENFENLKKRSHYSKSHLICDLIRAVHSVHKAGLIHRDIKPENILFKEGVLKLSDFGLSKVCKYDQHSTSCGTPFYMAPEMFSQQYYDQKVDIWGLGCVVYEILKGKHPFKARTIIELTEAQKKEIDLTGFKRKEVEFFQMIFQSDLNTRASIEDLINSRLVQSCMMKISTNLNNLYKSYDFFNSKNARIIRSAISFYICTDPLFKVNINCNIQELKTFAKRYNKNSFEPKLLSIFLKKIENETKNLNETNAILSNYLLYLHRRLLIIPNPTDYDILLQTD